MSSGVLTTRVFETLACGSVARDLWNRLLSRCSSRSVFSLPGWLEAWRQSIGRGDSITIVVVSCGDQPIVGGAFTLQGKDIVFAGKGPTDYSQLLIDSQYAGSLQLGVALDMLFSRARESLPEGRWFKLGRIPTEALTFQSLTGRDGRFRGVPTTRMVAPHMTMDNAASALKKKSLRRHENKLKRRGRLAIHTYRNAGDLDVLLPAFFDQHVRRWSTAGVGSQFERGEERDFVRLCCQEMSDAQTLRFTQVTSDGTDVAFHLGFSYASVYTWYKPSYDPDFAEYSPGEVLLKALIEQAVSEDVELFDFTVGDEKFKYRFANRYPDLSFVNVSDSRCVRGLFKVRNRLRSITK